MLDDANLQINANCANCEWRLFAICRLAFIRIISIVPKKMIRLKRLVKSFRYAAKGIIKTLREEQNLRIQSFIALIAIIFAVYFKINRYEWLALVFAISLVMLMELVNSAVERVADVFKPRLDRYVKDIKDITAAAVFLASITAAIIGVIIFWPHLFS